jgi:hypothetical protein
MERRRFGYRRLLILLRREGIATMSQVRLAVGHGAGPLAEDALVTIL